MKNIELTNSKEVELHNCTSQNFDNVGEPEPMSEILLTTLSNMWGGGQPDSDMKVDFAEIGIRENRENWNFRLFLPKISFFSEFWQNREQKLFWNFLFFTQNPLQLSEYSFLSQLKRSSDTFCMGGPIQFLPLKLFEICQSLGLCCSAVYKVRLKQK